MKESRSWLIDDSDCSLYPHLTTDRFTTISPKIQIDQQLNYRNSAIWKKIAEIHGIRPSQRFFRPVEPHLRQRLCLNEPTSWANRAPPRCHPDGVSETSTHPHVGCVRDSSKPLAKKKRQSMVQVSKARGRNSQVQDPKILGKL